MSDNLHPIRGMNWNAENQHNWVLKMNSAHLLFF
jgi:hypothetical protein